MKTTGFYIKTEEYGQKLGFAWYDADGNYRYVEALNIDKGPLMAAEFLNMFQLGMKKRIYDKIDKQ